MLNFFRMGFEAFFRGERCPEDATLEQVSEWKRGWDEAVHHCMMEEYRVA